MNQFRLVHDGSQDKFLNPADDESLQLEKHLKAQCAAFDDCVFDK